MGISRSFLIGVFCGLRAGTPSAVISWLRPQRWTRFPAPFSLPASPRGRLISTAGAGIELVGDKLPNTPSRTEPAGVGARLIAGALTGACVAPEGQTLPGALAGALGALAGTFGGHKLRITLPNALGVSDLPIALLEDAVAIGGSLAVTSSLPADDSIEAMQPIV
jgi:uncharacterized membrane protein